MSSTTDEDWSIISSSDYEEDVPSSPQNSSGGERDRERREDDSINVSVSTVKQIPDLQGASLGLYADSVLLTSGVASDPTQVLDKPPGKGANGAGAQTSVSIAHHECPSAQSGTQAPPSANDGSASAPQARTRVRSATARATQLFCDGNDSIQKSSRRIFNHSLESTRGQRRSFFSRSKIFVVGDFSFEFLKARKHVLLYVMLATTIFAYASGALGGKALFTGTLPSKIGRNSESPIWASMRSGGAPHLGSEPWVQKASDLAANFKSKCGATVLKVWDTVLYEDAQKPSSFFEKLFRAAPAKKLRFSGVWVSFNDRLNKCYATFKDIPVAELTGRLSKYFFSGNFSKLWASVNTRIQSLVTNPMVNAKINVWKDTVASISRQMFLGNEAMYDEYWQRFKNATQTGLISGQEQLRNSVMLAENWFARGGATNLTTSLIEESRNMADNFTTSVDLCVSRFFKWTRFIEQKAYDYQLRIDPLGNGERLVHTLKSASQTGFDGLSRRFNIVALEAYRISRGVTASWKQ